MLLTGLAVLGVLLALFLAAALATREREALAPAYRDAADVALPSGPLQPDDVRGLRFGLAARGYRMSEVDAALARLAAELQDRDARIAALEQEAPAAATVPAAPDGDEAFGAVAPPAPAAPANPFAPPPPYVPPAAAPSPPAPESAPPPTTGTVPPPVASSLLDPAFPDVLPYEDDQPAPPDQPAPADQPAPPAAPPLQAGEAPHEPVAPPDRPATPET